MTATSSSTKQITWFKCNDIIGNPTCNWGQKKMDFKTVDQNSMLIVYRQQSTSSGKVELWVYRDAKEGLYPYSRVLLEVNTSQNDELYWNIDPDQVKDEKEFYNYLTKARQYDIASGNSIARTKRSSKVSVKLEERQYLHIDDMIKKSNQSGK